MILSKSAQQTLFKELAKAEIRSLQNPEFNNYGIDEFGNFQNHLNSMYEKFESELSDNLTNQSPSLELYLTDLIKTLSDINKTILDYQKEEIYATQKENPNAFKRNRLGYMNYFLNFQLEIIEKTAKELNKKQELVKDPLIFKPIVSKFGISDNSAMLQSKIKSNLSKVDLTVLLWWLAEAKFFEFGESHDQFIKFVEDNFQFFDKAKQMYADAKHISQLMSKLNSPNCTETNPTQARLELLEALTKKLIPPEKSVLKKNKRTDVVA